MRILLFIATNIAILALLGFTFRLLGFEGLLAENGMDLDLQALLVYAAVIGFAGAMISLFLSKTIAIKSMGVRIIGAPSNEVEEWLLIKVKAQAEQSGIKMPDVGVFQSEAPNAFATGWNKNSALVAVSTGLMAEMSDDEVEAVLAHEVSHVANGDMVTMTLIQGVVNTFVVFLSRIIGHFVDRVVFKVERGHGPAFWITSIIAELILGVLAMIIVMWFSRLREFRADEGAARLVGKRKMISALQKLKGSQQSVKVPDEMAALSINAGKVHALFASHPPLDKRIAALQSL